jgi:hypothetical protein
MGASTMFSLASSTRLQFLSTIKTEKKSAEIYMLDKERAVSVALAVSELLI